MNKRLMLRNKQSLMLRNKPSLMLRNKPSLMLRNKLLVICGPTATGKTSLSIRLSRKFNGEIVSADSKQVFVGMDIATGKDLPKGSKFHEVLGLKTHNFKVGYYSFEGIPAWMLDVATPNQEFTVADYVEVAQKVIKNIWQRKKLPVLVGGTGFYIKALIDGIGSIGIPPDWGLRRELMEKSVKELFEMLARLNGERAALMNMSDRKNPRRLIRAIEIALKLKGGEIKKSQSLQADTLFVGLSLPYKQIYDLIDKRVNEQVELGAELEIRRLLDQGYNWDLPAMTAMGYGVLQSYFEGKEKTEEAIKKWKYEEHSYVRRQMTWFKKDKRINWYDLSVSGWRLEVERLISQWYNPQK